ncbi:hypothetical protein AB4587_13615 [Vibrio breoganii]
MSGLEALAYDLRQKTEVLDSTCAQMSGYQLSAISYQLSAISYQLSAISYRLGDRVVVVT